MRTPCFAVLGVTLAAALAPVSSAYAQRTLWDGIGDLAAQISSSVTQQQKTKVAVVPFRELDGRATVLGTYLAEALVTDLFKRGGLDIVERAMLDRILGELKLGESGLIDPGTAKRVGQVAGVEAIVTGTITDLQSFVAINCRLIDVQSGRVFAVAETKVVKDDDVRKIMGVPIAGGAVLSQPDEAGGRGASGTVSPNDGRRPEWSDRSLKVEVVGIARSRRDLKLTLLLSNLTRQDMRVGFGTTLTGQKEDPASWRTYIVDDIGNKYSLVASSVFHRGYDFGEVPLPPSTPLRVHLIFDGPSADANAITLVAVGAYLQGWTGVTVRLGPFRLPPAGN